MKKEKLFNVKGVLKIDTIEKSTGKVLDSFEENNVFLTQGYELFIDSVLNRDTNNFQFNCIQIGDDVGTGDNFNPEQPQASYTEADQSPVYAFPTSDFAGVLSVPFQDSTFLTSVRTGSKTLTMTVLIDGDEVITKKTAELGSPIVSLEYTSAVIYTESLKAVAFRRFESAKSINALVDVSLSWSLTFECGV